MLDQALALSLDPAAILSASGMTPDVWQERVLRSGSTRLLVLASRQCGKSTTVAAMALNRGLFAPGSLTLLVSASQRQSQELLRRVMDLYGPVSGLMPIEAQSASRLEFANAARIVSLPSSEETVRGYSKVSLLVFDEAARIGDSLAVATRPMLAAAKGGRLVAVSTGGLRQGFFFRAWTGEDGEDWQREEIRADACPRIAPEFLQQERASLGPAAFAAEYGAAFIDGDGRQFFDQAAIDAAFSTTLQPLVIS